MRAHLFGFAPGLFLLTLVVAAYGQFLPLYFAGGDTLALIWSSRLESPLDALSLFSEPLLSGTSFPFDTGRFFRPVATLSYGLTYALVGLNPLAFHLTDLALHAGVCVGALMLLRRLGMEAWASAFAIGIFALHPLMVAVVPDIARRHDPLAALLVLTACLSASRALCASQTERRSNWYLAGAVIALTLAEMAKEVASPQHLWCPPLHSAQFSCRRVPTAHR